jgi:osmotically-inducible protein OsmY
MRRRRAPYQPDFGWEAFRAQIAESSGERWKKARDTRIEAAVSENLSLHPNLDETAIVVSSVEGVVTLRGRLEALCHCRVAVEVARSVPGVRDVKNELEVEEGKGVAEITKAA